MDELTVSSQASEGVLRVVVAGPVLVTTAWRLQDEVDQVLHEPGTVGLEVDLAGVSLLDSSGISVLLMCLTAATRAGRPFAVTNPTPFVHRSLQVLGLLDSLGVHSRP